MLKQFMDQLLQVRKSIKSRFDIEHAAYTKTTIPAQIIEGLSRILLSLRNVIRFIEWRVTEIISLR